MDLGTAVARPLATKVIDWVAKKGRGSDLPLTTDYLTFHPPTGTFSISLENKTAKKIELESIKLRAFHRRSFREIIDGERRRFQPLDLEILPIGNEQVGESFGLQEGCVPPYAMAKLGMAHELVPDRIVHAERLEFVGIEQEAAVFKTSTRTQWLRDSIKDAVEAGTIEIRDEDAEDSNTRNST